jgi:hypothetical protein
MHRHPNQEVPPTMTDIVDLPLDQPLEHLRISPWHDPVVDAIGHDPRSTYVERFWLALLGPSTTFLVRHLAAALEAEPEGFDLHLEDTARALGLGHRGGANGPFYRAIARTGQFHITRSAGPGHLSVRLRLQPLTHRQLSRLPERLQAEHRIWMAQHEVPDEEQRRQRARRLALSLLELGETTQAAELQLHRWKVHPALAHDALRWAEARRSAQPLSFDQPASTPASVRTPNPVPPLVVSSHAAEA